jgi:polyisoprenoid-binding protein YceI
LLDCARLPVITFADGRVLAEGLAIVGELAVWNVTRPVTVLVRHVAVPVGSFTASAAVRAGRAEFGMTGFSGLTARYLDLLVVVWCAEVTGC